MLKTTLQAGVKLDAHAIEDAVVVRYRDGSDSATSERHQLISLKDFSDDINVSSLADLIISKCSIITTSSKQELEQVLFYLQRRSKSLNGSRTGSASSHSENGSVSMSIKANMNDIESYIESFYEEDIHVKCRGAQAILELARVDTNLLLLIENERLNSSLVRILREDWKKSFDLATAIIRIFEIFSFYNQFHSVLAHHKVGAQCLAMLEYELKRGDAWAAEMRSADERLARKWRVALRKQHVLVSACTSILTNLAIDLNIELKMVRRGIVPLMLQYLKSKMEEEFRKNILRLLLKLSIFEENKSSLEQTSVIELLVSMFPISDEELRRLVVQLLFNLSFSAPSRTFMITAGLVAHIAPLVDGDVKALNLLYILSINDEAKAMITYTDTIQSLMRSILEGNGNSVTKGLLMNTCIEKRNAQLVCGDGQGLDLLMDQVLTKNDLLVAKIVRNISVHDGPTQEMFSKWVPSLIEIGCVAAVSKEEERAAFGLELLATAAQVHSVEWVGICESQQLIEFMGEHLKSNTNQAENEPLLLQIVIMCGTMARQMEAAKALVPLLDTFLQLLHSMQTDDEFVVQLLFVFLQLLRHKELAERLMGSNSALGDYIIDLMHDKNQFIREQCENALVIIGEHSQEWARRIAAERFRFHNDQWLMMIEAGQPLEEHSLMDDDLGAEILFDDQFDDGFDLAADERIF